MPDIPLPDEVLTLIQDFMDRADAAGCDEPSAMTVATTGPDHHVTARVVLLRGLDPRGLVFYTNKESLKGEQLRAVPRAAAVLYQGALREQIRIEGRVVEVSDEENDAYWAGRPRENRLGAWASDQSRPLETPEALLARFESIAAEYPEGTDIPRPAHWGGYRILPDRVERWVFGGARLHDRHEWRVADDRWVRGLLFP